MPPPSALAASVSFRFANYSKFQRSLWPQGSYLFRERETNARVNQCSNLELLALIKLISPIFFLYVEPSAIRSLRLTDKAKVLQHFYARTNQPRRQRQVFSGGDDFTYVLWAVSVSTWSPSCHLGRHTFIFFFVLPWQLTLHMSAK